MGGAVPTDDDHDEAQRGDHPAEDHQRVFAEVERAPAGPQRPDPFGEALIPTRFGGADGVAGRAGGFQRASATRLFVHVRPPRSSPSGHEELVTDSTLSAKRPEPNQKNDPAISSSRPLSTATSGAVPTNATGEAAPIDPPF